TPVFCVPVLSKSAATPTAVFASPLLRSSAPAPTAVLKLAVVVLNNEYAPSAVLPAPLVRLRSAFCPSAVVKLGYAPSAGGTTPNTFVEDRIADQATASKITNSGFIFLNWISGFMVLFLLFFPTRLGLWNGGSGRDEEPSGAESSALIQDPFGDVEVGENAARLSRPTRA